MLEEQCDRALRIDRYFLRIAVFPSAEKFRDMLTNAGKFHGDFPRIADMHSRQVGTCIYDRFRVFAPHMSSGAAQDLRNGERAEGIENDAGNLFVGTGNATIPFLPLFNFSREKSSEVKKT